MRTFTELLRLGLCDPKLQPTLANFRQQSLPKVDMDETFVDHPLFDLESLSAGVKEVQQTVVHKKVEGFISVEHIPSKLRWIGNNKYQNNRRRSVHNASFWYSDLVTVTEWERVVGWFPPKLSSQPEQPIPVGWLDAVIFCNQYSQSLFLDPIYEFDRPVAFNLPVADQVKILANMKAHISNNGFRLPSEVEWEIILGEASSITQWEWCTNIFSQTSPTALEPTVDYSHVWRTIRGGEGKTPQAVRLFERQEMLGYQSLPTIGFRLLRRVSR